MIPDTVPVLVVGGGVAGLGAALFLAQHGVRALLVEKHAGTSIYPRARGVNGRTMELMRELGLDAAIQAAGAALAPAMGIYRGTSLVEVLDRVGSGSWLMRRLRARGTRGHASKTSPTGPCRCTQDLLEPILLDAARARGVDARFATELVELAQDADGVSAEIADRSTGARRSVRAAYAIAADGARSPLRAQLGIARTGSSEPGHQVNVYFRADLAALVRGRELSMCLVDNPRVYALIASINNADLWVVHISYSPAAGEQRADFTPARCVELVRAAVGVSDLAVEIKGTSAWQSEVRIAERFRAGRVFLAGDAAHAMPPWGGFGANAAIQDAHNLAWKLAAVLAGTAGPGLLDTYEAERRPVGRAVAELAGRMNGARGLMALPASRLGSFGMLWNMRRVAPYLTLGYGYTSAAVVNERGPQPGPGTTELRGRPGTRAPHVWLERAGERISMLDLFGRGFVLLLGPRSARAFESSSMRSAGSPTVDVVRIDATAAIRDPAGAWCRAYGIRPTGAVLVRPDGFVAWRAASDASPAMLARVLPRILAREAPSSASSSSAHA